MNPTEYDIMASVEDAHWWWRARREIVASVIRRHAPPAGGRRLRLAEIGCGTGGNLPTLAEFGDVLGAEASDLALAHLRRKFGTRFEILEHRLPDELPHRFDVLCMMDVLEHLRDDAQALRWVATHLAPGGIAVITVPAFDALWTGQDEVARHFRRYTPDGLARLVPPGLDLVHLTCFNTILFPPILAVRTAMRWSRRPGSAPSSHLGVPPRFVNELLFRLFRVERHVVPRFRVQVGVSALLVVRRPPR